MTLWMTTDIKYNSKFWGSHELVDYVINKWWCYKWKHKVIILLNVFHPYDIHEGEQNDVDI
jgi:hypothetical protein